MVQRSVGNPLSGEGLSNFARHIDDVCKAGKHTYPFILGHSKFNGLDCEWNLKDIHYIYYF